MKILNRNHLKIIAIITMLIDHIGAIFFPNLIIFRIIGRLAYPLFAFFIAEGYHYTKNRKKYFLTILIFAIISQPIYYFALHSTGLNILFTFLFSIIFIYLWEHISQKVENYVLIIIYSFFLITLAVFDFIDYGFIGVIIPVLLYLLRDKPKIKWIVFSALLLVLSLLPLLSGNFIQFFGLLALPLLFLYNGQKGKWNLKYMFYIFYPAHLLVLLIINLIV